MFNQIDPKQLSYPKTFEEIEKKAKEIIRRKDKEEAKTLALELQKGLDKILGRIPTALCHKYKDLIIKLRICAGPPFTVPRLFIYQIPDLTAKNLEDLNVQKEIEKATFEITEHLRAEEARVLAKELEEKIEESTLSSDLKNNYNKILARLKLVAIPALPIDQVCEALKKYFVNALEDKDIDIFERIRLFLFKLPIEVRDENKVELRKALEESEQKIGEEKITILREEHPVDPEIRFWLKDYNHYLGAGIHTEIDRGRYLFKNINCKGLSEENSKKLSELFKFYDLLNVSSWEVGALDNPSVEMFSQPLGVIGFSQEILKPSKTATVASPTSWMVRKPAPPPRPLALPPAKPAKPPAPPSPPKPAITPPVVPPKPPAEIEKEIEAKRKAEEERMARLEREMKPKVAPPPKVEVPKPKPPIPTEAVALPKIKPAPEFKPAKPPRIKAVPPPLKPAPVKPRIPVKITSLDDVKKLTASDFRSYAEVPRDSSRAIAEKINSLLAKASPLDKIKALSSWKESNLYKLYIEMGRESMAQGIPVKELAEKRKAEGKPHLTHEEFEAIAEISGAIG